MAANYTTPTSTAMAAGNDGGRWEFQKGFVERNMDGAAYQAAHPDNTLLLAGPSRYAVHTRTESALLAHNSLFPIGQLQTFSLTSTIPLQPMQAIGSGRTFFVTGKSQNQFTFGRLMLNGRNLNRALYHNVAESGTVNASLFDEAAAHESFSPYFTNLDSELYKIPFGVAILFADKLHNWIGACYLELCMLNNNQLQIQMGQPQLLENAQGMCDRVMPISLVQLLTRPGNALQSVNEILGFLNAPNNTGVEGNWQQFGRDIVNQPTYA